MSSNSKRSSSMGEPWIYYRIYVDALSRTSPLLEGVAAALQPIRPRLRHWHFLQYLDHQGPHLRVRIQPLHAGTVDADEWGRALEQAAAQAGMGSARVLRRHYGPEAVKFGGALGLEVAHQLFTNSSDLAAQLRPIAGVASEDLCAGSMLALVDAAAGRLPEGFLYHYGWYWLGRGTLGGGWRSALLARSRDSRAMLALGERTWRAGDEILADPTIGVGLRAHAARLCTVLDQNPPQGWGQSVALVAHHHLHLTNNRLGIEPAIEARVARLLALGSGRRAGAAAAR